MSGKVSEKMYSWEIKLCVAFSRNCVSNERKTGNHCMLFALRKKTILLSSFFASDQSLTTSCIPLSNALKKNPLSSFQVHHVGIRSMWERKKRNPVASLFFCSSAAQPLNWEEEGRGRGREGSPYNSFLALFSHYIDFAVWMLEEEIEGGKRYSVRPTGFAKSSKKKKNRRVTHIIFAK